MLSKSGDSGHPFPVPDLQASLSLVEVSWQWAGSWCSSQRTDLLGYVSQITAVSKVLLVFKVVRDHLSGAGPKSWSYWYGNKILRSSERSFRFWTFSAICATVLGVWFMARLYPSLLLSLMQFLLFAWLVVITQPGFRFLKDIVLYVAADSVSARSRFSYVVFLNQKPLFLYSFLVFGYFLDSSDYVWLSQLFL